MMGARAISANEAQVLLALAGICVILIRCRQKELMGLTRVNVHRRSRRDLGRNQYPSPNAFAATITSVGTQQAQAVFPTAIVLKGIPQWSVSSGLGVPTSVVLSNSTTLLLNYSGTIATKTMTVPAGDPSIHSQTGATVAAQSKTF